MADTAVGVSRVNGPANPALRPRNTKSLCSKFHAECDVAALVYRAGEDPDPVLWEFVHDLRGKGHDAAGLLQCRNLDHRDIYEPIEFFLVPSEDGQTLRREKCGRATESCGAQLQELGAGLARALERRPDVVVLNRFGWLEVNGSGLLNVLGEAIDLDVPVLIGVPEGLFDSWLSVVQGLAVKLRCDRADLDRWWSTIKPAFPRADQNLTFCECYK